MSQITVVGTGPGPLKYLTTEAKEVLLAAGKIFFRMASLPVFIFDYARSPYEDWNRQAWGAALVLLVLVALLSASMRLATRRVPTR